MSDVNSQPSAPTASIPPAESSSDEDREEEEKDYRSVRRQKRLDLLVKERDKPKVHILATVRDLFCRMLPLKRKPSVDMTPELDDIPYHAVFTTWLDGANVNGSDHMTYRSF